MDKEKINAKRVAVNSLALVSGWRILQQAGSAVTEVVAASGRIADLAKKVLTRRKPRHETFTEAQERLGLTDADLRQRLKHFNLQMALCFFVFCVSLSFLMISPLVNNPVSHALNSAGLMFMSIAGCLVWRFRICQVQDREFYSFGGWVAADRVVRQIGYVSIIILLLALGVFSSIAHAAESGAALHAFTPAAGDASVTFLREIFGPVIDTIWSNSNSTGEIQKGFDSPLGAMLGPFNSGMLFIGMIFVAYTTIKGTVDSAHDGEVLGKKMSEIWVPIRTVGGSALVLPGASGYSIIQFGVLWLAIQSAGIGNAILGAGLDYIAETNMVARPHLPDTRQLAAGILRYEVCAAAMNKQYEESGWKKRIVPEEKTTLMHNSGEVGVGDVALAAGGGLAAGPLGAIAAAGYTAYKSTYRVTEFHWRAMENGKPALLSPDVCGALTWEESHESAEGNGNTRIAASQIMAAQANAVRQMIVELRPIAQQIVAFKSLKPGAIEIAATNYENALATAAKTAVQQSSDARRAEFIEAVRAGGWIYLPTYYNQLIQLNDVMQSALNALPATSPISIEDKSTEETLQNYHDAMTVANEYLKARVDAPVQERKRQFKQDGEFPTSWGDFKRLLSGFAQTGIYEFTQQLAGSNLSHVGQIKAVGDTIMGSAETIAMMVFVANGAANSNAAKLTVGNVFDVGSALGSINPMVMTIALSLLFFGAMAAYYIPLIPFIVGITAVIKWFVLVFESVIAAPIFAVAHMHPDGHDAVGKAGPGYMMILGLLLRPVLTVFGFFGSIWLAQPVTGYINIAYMTAVQGAEHNSFSFIAAFVAYVIIYVIIMTGVIHSVFTLVNWLPDNVLRWIGGALNAHGVGDNESKEAEHSYRGAVAAIGRGGHGAGQGGTPKKPGGNNLGGGKGDGDGKPSQADKDRANAEHLGSPS